MESTESVPLQPSSGQQSQHYLKESLLLGFDSVYGNTEATDSAEVSEGNVYDCTGADRRADTCPSQSVFGSRFGDMIAKNNATVQRGNVGISSSIVRRVNVYGGTKAEGSAQVRLGHYMAEDITHKTRMKTMFGEKDKRPEAKNEEKDTKEDGKVDVTA
ncbi:hypothetical protein K491DRAFT_696771 [Lophiostoma macrostomum CBS 122681]|uniref:Uncharacterized protein n=1 Tax=Lophiostoma macrostomum CBS 122681 TaxID=1314788 RepID=A0A6A6SVH5_9PLEO|nr:hypothetical protein K491DRAFT_696771 [Lophiostoma macrostomum CBS 122681]